MQHDEVTVELPSTPLAPRAAREATRRVLGRWAMDQAADDVLLLVSELVTNAVFHAESSVTVALRTDGRAVRVEVHDDSPVAPVQDAFTDDALRGRGIALVDAVSTRWGVDAVPGDGKTVWFEVQA